MVCVCVFEGFEVIDQYSIVGVVVIGVILFLVVKLWHFWVDNEVAD